MRGCGDYIGASSTVRKEAVGKADEFPRDILALFDSIDHLADYGIVVELFVVIVAESVIVILQQRLTELLLGRMNREAGSRGGCDVADDYRFGHCDGSYLRMRKAEFCEPEETRSEEHTSEL